MAAKEINETSVQTRPVRLIANEALKMTRTGPSSLRLAASDLWGDAFCDVLVCSIVRRRRDCRGSWFPTLQRQASAQARAALSEVSA